ncbi:GrpB domain, predicted nucleotidyltransferase, UPF0157 family [Neorhodopirellula lusitana]|uniref:GrpB domain, predicted nucleotidyltransferase, UPF0157 family n=1 Tax=Neorhodopirellula lusitana TaxID=445327 RepID=A0ABY1PT84_9BACT|nr:GrpB family protein [Neorhodopirellula lusitana]SMP40315.1 GrpB domain, predicted nucleotidyltransferase, UPF0157 family [Neorhodopirellula lusitana]
MQSPWTDEDSKDPSSAIRLMHHDARWKQEFEQTRSGILQCCEGRVVEVEHVGATAVGGLIARPVIDVVAVVADPCDLSEAVDLIIGLNFRTVDLSPWAGRLPPKTGPGATQCCVKPRHGSPTHLVYVVSQGAALLSQMVRLRDYLRAAPERAIELEEKKLEIWRGTDADPLAYYEAMANEFEELQRKLGQ